MEIRKYDLPTNRLTWVGARDACASKNNWGHLSSTFHVEQSETLIEWKFESMTNQPTDRLTWVGARDACASKELTKLSIVAIFDTDSHINYYVLVG